MRLIDGKWRSGVLCVQCNRVPANTLDHIQSHEGDEVLFWDESNLQALCAGCHGSKSSYEKAGVSYPDLSDIYA